MARTPPLAPESLLVHDDFVRRLARQLLRDASAADDVGQQAWLAVLQRPADAGGQPQSWRAFLATLVRRLCQRQQRRERRELARRAAVAAGHDGASPSVAALHAREAQRARVVAAVLALPDPYRDVVVLRWFEGLPPRAIARRLGLPVETVRTRHKRALAQLARTLDGEAGDRAAWALPLAVSAPRAEATTTVALGGWFLPGVLLMSLQTKLVASFVVVAALLCLAWPLWSSPPAAGPEAAGTPPASATAAAATGVADPSAATAQAATPSPTERTAAPGADAAAALASLQVTVRYADEQPAADVVVVLHRSGDDDPRTRPPRARTDARGVVQFAGLAPGRVFATVARGGWQWGDGVGLEAGRRSEVVVRLARGMDLRGVVVDRDDRPVAGATIVASSWGGGDVEELGTSGADGTFALRAIATHCHVGAYGAGFAPSPLRQFTASDGAVVDTRIVLTAPAAALRGTVVDGGGQVVSGAIVRAGDFEQRNAALPDGGQAMGWRPQTTRSDAQGRFEFASLPAERLPLQVTAEGHAPWHQPVDVVAGRANEVAVVLGPGASVHGCVRDALGQPVARAEIELGEWSQPGHRRTRTRDDGTFVFDDVLPGEIVASAVAETRGRCKATLQLAPGQRTRWDPVLQAGKLLRGRVQSRTGTPISGVMVQGTAPAPGQEFWHAMANTDAEGRFQLTDCPDRPLRLELLRKSSFPELVVDAQTPPADEWVLTLPDEAWVHLVGRILDADGAPVANVHVSPFLQGGHGSPAETADPGTGAFRLGPYPPGRYTLRLSAAGFVPIERTQDVAGDSTWDLGELRFQRGGFVELALQQQAPQAGEVQFLAIADADGARHQFVARGGPPRAGPLAAGSYRLVAWGEQVGAVTQPFTVVADRTTTVDVPLARGQRVTLRAVRANAAAAAMPVSTIVEFTVADADGRELGRPAAAWHDGAASVAFGLLPGRYTITAVVIDHVAASSAAGATWRGSAVLAVPAAGADAANELRVELAPR